jgi:hypothetical protein
MRKLLPLCSLLLLLGFSQSATAGELKLTIANGRVTLIADAVPIRTVLQEWAKLGQSQIVNGEKVQGAPLTLQLIDVPEEQALDIVLRSASGYLAAPRATAIANASRFDRIVILAMSRPTSTTAAAPPPQHQPMPQPFPTPPILQQPVGDDQDESDEPRPEDAPEPAQPSFATRPGPIPLTPDPNAPEGLGQLPPGVNPPPGLNPQQLPWPVTSPRPGLIQPPQQPQPQPPSPARPIP